MNTFEKNLRTDTILSTGLVAFAIAWIAIAAVQRPADTGSRNAAAEMVVTAVTAPLQPGTGLRAATLPVGAKRAAGNKVS